MLSSKPKPLNLASRWEPNREPAGQQRRRVSRTAPECLGTSKQEGSHLSGVSGVPTNLKPLPYSSSTSVHAIATRWSAISAPQHPSKRDGYYSRQVQTKKGTLADSAFQVQALAPQSWLVSFTQSAHSQDSTTLGNFRART